MSQANTIPQTGPKSGVQMADAIQDAVDAINSGHLGATEPSYKTEGMRWVKEVSATLNEVYEYDGASWILVRSYNPTTHALIETKLAANQVTVAELEQIAQGIILGRTSASTGNVEKLTAAQVMALLPNFVGDSWSGGTAGRVPAPAAGDAAAGKFLKADGTWGEPPSGTEPGAYGFFAMETAPAGWLECYGQNVSRSTYASLFAAIGTVFGAGNGSTTFTLPDLRGRGIAGWDSMGGTSANRLTGTISGLNGDTFGAAGGVEHHALTTAQIPAHAHDIPAYATPNSGAGVGMDKDNSGGLSQVASSSVGSGEAHTNMQPTMIGLICIKY